MSGVFLLFSPCATQPKKQQHPNIDIRGLKKKKKRSASSITYLLLRFAVYSCLQNHKASKSAKEATLGYFILGYWVV